MAFTEPRLSRFHLRSDQQHQASKITDADFLRLKVTATLRYISTDLRVIDTSTLFRTTARISCESFFIIGNEDEDLRNEVLLQRLLLPGPWSLENFSECLNEISLRIVPQVQKLFDYDPGFIKPPGSEYQVFPMSLEIVIDVPSDEENQEMELTDEEIQELESAIMEESMQMELTDEEIQELESAIMEESMQSVRMVPASKNAINSLKKFKVMKLNEHCTICLEEFDVSGDDDNDDLAASAMPCDHVFHQQCIVQWLQTSHVCPLCRYPMPTANEY